MKRENRAFSVFCLLFAAVSLVSCGGGTSGGASGGNTGSTVSGVVASGGAITGIICLKDATSREVCYDSSDGRFSFDVSGLTPPFMLKAEWTDGNGSRKLYSFAPAAGVANINPLSNLAVVSAAGVSDLAAIYAAPSANVLGVISSNLPAAITILQNKLKPLLDRYPGAGIDPISGAFSADHTGLDRLFDENAIVLTEGVVTVQDKLTGATAFNSLVNNIAGGVVTLLWTDQDALVAQDPQVAVDPNGDAFVIWTQTTEGHDTIQAKRYTPATGWGDVTPVGSSGDAGFPQIGADASGNAVAVWSQYTGGSGSIWGNRYRTGMGWETPTRIGDIINEASYPKLSVNADGNAVAAWYQWDGSPGGTGFSVWASCYTAGTGWGVPTTIGTSGQNAYRPEAGIDAHGNAFAVWIEGSQFNQDIWASRYIPGTGWSAPTAIGNHAGAVYAQAQLAVGRDGNAIAVWGQYGATGYNIWANRYAIGSGWGTPVKIGGSGDSYHPGIGMGSNGNALVVWQETDGTRYNLWSNAYSVASGWGTPVQAGSTDDAHDAVLRVDAGGGAVAVWYQMGSTPFTVWMNRYVPGSGWSAASLLDTIVPDDFLQYPTPALGMNSSGYSVAVWGLDSM